MFSTLQKKFENIRKCSGLFKRDLKTSENVQDSAKERAEQIFLALDFNGDGELCENEFVTGCMQV